MSIDVVILSVRITDREVVPISWVTCCCYKSAMPSSVHVVICSCSRCQFCCKTLHSWCLEVGLVGMISRNRQWILGILYFDILVSNIELLFLLTNFVFACVTLCNYHSWLTASQLQRRGQKYLQQLQQPTTMTWLNLRSHALKMMPTCNFQFWSTLWRRDSVTLWVPSWNFMLSYSLSTPLLSPWNWYGMQELVCIISGALEWRIKKY